MALAPERPCPVWRILMNAFRSRSLLLRHIVAGESDEPLATRRASHSDCLDIAFDRYYGLRLLVDFFINETGDVTYNFRQFVKVLAPYHNPEEKRTVRMIDYSEFVELG